MNMTAHSSDRTTALSVAMVCFALCASGCGDITGKWERRDWKDDDTRNVMTLGSDETGSATIHYVLTEAPDTWYQDEFEIDWTERSGEQYDLELVCFASTRTSGSCDGDDFTMSCDLSSSASKLDCTGSDEWTGYEFEWDKK